MICISCSSRLKVHGTTCTCGQKYRVRPMGDVGFQVTFSPREHTAKKEVKDGDLRTA